MSDVNDTVLIVDDEEPVRRTFREWLDQAGFGCTILTASEAESALQQANDHVIDLAILDWNLGTGDDGLQLLQDLSGFHPDVVAIMVTGFANQATPLDAMRMGVRDYLDKNHDLNRDTFLQAVKKQLDQIRPAKRARRLYHSLASFREAVEKILPLVQSTAALNDPVPLPDAIRSLVRFLIQATQSRDGVLFVRRYDAARQPAESCRLYDANGVVMETATVPFARSVAGSVASLQQPHAMNDLAGAPSGMVELQPFEQAHRRLLAVPLMVGSGVHVVIELFDREQPYGPAEQQLARSAAEVGTELLRQALGQRDTHQLLLDAVGAALRASEQVSASLDVDQNGQPPPAQVMEQLRASLAVADPDGASEVRLRLAEAIRSLASTHGTAALDHCLRLVQSVRDLLEQTSGAEPYSPSR
jgi:two-component system nitrogen regulation response regulator NtrX